MALQPNDYNDNNNINRTRTDGEHEEKSGDPEHHPEGFRRVSGPHFQRRAIGVVWSRSSSVLVILLMSFVSIC